MLKNRYYGHTDYVIFGDLASLEKWHNTQYNKKDKVRNCPDHRRITIAIEGSAISQGH